MRVLILIMFTMFANSVLAEVYNCGVVTIEEVIAGPRHGAMMRVSDVSCGADGGWVCLDPDAQYMQPSESERLFSLVLAMNMSHRPIQLSVSKGVYANACKGPYSVVEDIRTR